MAGYTNTAFVSSKFDIIGDDDFQKKVKILFDELWALKDDLGKDFIRELDSTPHTIGIKKGNNTTSVSGENQYYKLIAAFRTNNWVEARKQLQASLSKSFFSTADKLAKQLVAPTPGLTNYAFTPAQVKALDAADVKFGAPKTAPMFSPKGLFSSNSVKESTISSLEKQWEKALTKFLAGGDCLFTAAEQYTMIARKLEPWLERGTGVPAVIGVDLTKDEVTCAFDGTKGKRPVAIGFAHELIHVYYSVTGQRLYEFEKIHDESLTTGLPPDHFRKYTENHFRTAWPEGKLDLRLFYFNQERHRICAYCGHANIVDLNVAKVLSGETKVHPDVKAYFKALPQGSPKYQDLNLCQKCGKSLPAQAQSVGHLPASTL
ncbi:hypothetical protein [Bryobacter aggregatus]|uniref:hypothetical protein n=1 Tax=Bryobacter aggregatus TaxID=360054 RepID=UPI0004E1C9F2|nr:hypothetical protein [Bryobacter aggregatus]